ncbi:hypothetical protein D3C78_1025400 [compost metagenome]
MDRYVLLHRQPGTAVAAFDRFPCRQGMIIRMINRIKFERAILNQLRIKPTIRRMIQILEKYTEQVT